jgi:hypothetical protein
MVLRYRRTALCPVCGRRITLTVTGGRFRRHMSSKGVVCLNSWKTPAAVAPAGPAGGG